MSILEISAILGLNSPKIFERMTMVNIKKDNKNKYNKLNIGQKVKIIEYYEKMEKQQLSSLQTNFQSYLW